MTNLKPERRNLAVIGDPISHSLSPVMQNAGLKALGLDIKYTAIHVTSDKLEEFIRYAKDNLAGFNITVPHKQAIIKFLDNISYEAEIAQSVNTVSINDEGKMAGATTDGFGLKMAIREVFGMEVANNTFCFIGCGGAVQSVAFYFAQKRAAKLNFINRTISKAENLCNRINNLFPDVRLDLCGNTDTETIKKMLEESKVVIQGTSLGLKYDDPIPIPPSLLPPDICIYETIYKSTPLIKYAENNNIKHGDGRTMLLYQGVKSLEIWTNRAAPVEIMRDALYKALTRQSGN